MEPDAPQELTLAEVQELWPDLLKQLYDTRRLYVELSDKGPRHRNKAIEALREWWSLVNKALWCYAWTHAHHGQALEPFPINLIGNLIYTAEELSTGIIPSWVANAKKGGRPLYSGERKAIAYGVLYIEAVRRGEIKDRSPNKTVRQGFNVTAKSVQNWMRRSAELRIGIPLLNLSPDELRQKMLEHGALYARHGRGAPADN
ncbi:MAG: hypothetical protein ACR2PG_11790 [Hyphomicrobiaceae bacterium]